MNYKTIEIGNRIFLAEWEPEYTYSFLLRIYDVTDSPVRFVGKVITNDVDKLIEILTDAYLSMKGIDYEA